MGKLQDTVQFCTEQYKMKRYVTCDIHGNFKALKQVLKKSKFDYENDLLIVIGDVCDGYSYTRNVVDELLKIKNVIFVIGNHDIFTLDFITKGKKPYLWLNQGGWNTLKSYDKNIGTEPVGNFLLEYEGDLSRVKIPKEHFLFLSKGLPYYELDNMLFVHGGFDYPKHPKDCDLEELTWDRELLERCKNGLKIKEWKKVFIGHTTTERLGAEPIILDFNPKESAKVIQLDCGAGWSGRLCLYNIDTDEYFLSSYTSELYDREKGR